MISVNYILKKGGLLNVYELEKNSLFTLYNIPQTNSRIKCQIISNQEMKDLLENYLKRKFISGCQLILKWKIL